MSVETTDSPVSVERFARVFVKGPEELPSHADTYYDPGRGYYFKLHLDQVSTEQATPLIEKANERFEVELVRRVTQDGFFKERVYVESAEEAPDGHKVHTGPHGGLYYETGVQQVAAPDESAETRNVAVIHWADVELGDEIVFETPDGEETFAEISYIEERGEETDVIHVEHGGETYRARPGTYTVDNSEEKSLSASVRMVKAGDWVRYQGPRGGKGWRHIQTGEVIYQDSPPGEAEGSDDGYGDDFDPHEPPDGGYALGWTGPPDDRSEITVGQDIEWFEDDGYHYGEVTEEDGDSIRVDPDEGDEREVDFSQITAREQLTDGPEMHFSETDPESFVEGVEQMIEEDPEMGAFLTAHDPEEMAEHTLISSADGSAGAAVSPEGDIQNVYAHNDAPSGAGEVAFREAIEAGGQTLDCYDTILPTLYARHGFVEVARQEFNPEFAPDGWNEEKFGQPDVVFMAYDPETVMDVGHEVADTYEDDWGRAKQLSRERAIEKSRGGATAGGDARGARRGVRRGTRRVDSGGRSAAESDLKADGSDATHSARYSPEDDDDEEWPHERYKDCDGHHFGPYLEAPSLRLEEGEAYCEVEGETFRTDEGDDVVTTCPICGEGLGDPGEVPGPNGEVGHLGKNAAGEWVSFVGPQGGEGWVNLLTGEKRYQKQRPGPTPEGHDEPEFADGWEPLEDYDDLQFGQMVEMENYQGEFEVGTYEGLNEEGNHVVEPENDPEASIVVGDEFNNQITAVEADFDRHDPWFEEEDFGPEEYFAVHDEVPPDASEEFQPYDVGQEVSAELPNDDIVSMPIYGYIGEDDDHPMISSESLVFHYDDLESEVGQETMHDRWGEPGDASPLITLPAHAAEGMIVDEEPEPSDEEPEEDEEEQFWDEDDLGEEEWLHQQDIEPGTPFLYEVGGEAYPARPIGATDMTTDDEAFSHVVLEVDVPHMDEPHTTPVHPNIVPDTIDDPESPLDGYVETANNPGFDADEYDSVGTLDIGEVPEGAQVVIADDATSPISNYVTAEVYPNGIGYDPGDGDTIYPEDVDVVAVHEDDADAVAEDEEPEEEATTPSEDEAASAVAQPASEDTEDYNLDEYRPEDAEEFRDMSDIGANHGNSVSAMEVAVLPDGSKMVHKDLSHHTVSEDDIERELSGYHAAKHLDDRVPVHTADLTEGWAASEVAPGVDAVDATPEMKEAVSFDDFAEMAAVQLIIGNTDLHQNNVRVDEDGELYAFDLDRAAGDIQGDWVGNLTHYDNTLDRALGELQKAANALDVHTEAGFGAEIVNRAEEIAAGIDAETYSQITDEVGEVNPEFAATIRENIDAFATGEVSL